MNKIWITGKEVQEQLGILPVMIGKACFEGKLKAYHPTTGDEICSKGIKEISEYEPKKDFLFNADEYIRLKFAEEQSWIDALDSIERETAVEHDDDNNSVLNFLENKVSEIKNVDEYDRESNYLGDYIDEIKMMIFKSDDIRSCFVNTASPVAEEQDNVKNIETTATLSDEDKKEAYSVWHTYYSTITPSRERQAGHIAMLKFSDKVHEEIFDIVFKNEKSVVDGTKRKRITGYKKLVQSIAQKNNLPVPPGW
ncbi:MAG: hypothetical protein FWH34_01080 [Desulfovibrionaceae bacterium]|nr:hypothetical protein [Desulfovibrionaceae bacterium]